MRWEAILVGSAAGFLIAASPPQPTVMQRHALLRIQGTKVCFERLAHGSPQVGATIIQAGTNATDLCGCVGELFATSLISTDIDQAKLTELDTSPDQPATRLFDSFNQLCFGRLQPVIGK
jgi:hypothetical protein